MPKFYFTYGSEGHDFFGGWTEIEAPSYSMATEIFRAVHPNEENSWLKCSSVYTEEEFKRTRMAGPEGNFGRFCHERITVTRFT